MDIEVRAIQVHLTTAQRVGVVKRVGLALCRFERRIHRVLVVIEDVNGPKGGRDKRCRIRARGVRGFTVHAQATDTTVAAAVGRTCHAIVRNVTKAVRSRRDFSGRDRTSMAGERRTRR